MKVQFVFASFLVCSLLGELFGELVEESDYVVVDDADSLPERRAVMYDPGCIKVPESKVYSRIRIPRRNSKFRAHKSNVAYEKIQFPRYQDNFIDSSPGESNFKNLRDLQAKQYPTIKRILPNNNGRFGKGQRYPFKPMQNFGVDGQYLGANKGKRSGKVYMMSLRDKNGRELYRRMLDAAETEDEDATEDAQDY